MLALVWLVPSLSAAPTAILRGSETAYLADLNLSKASATVHTGVTAPSSAIVDMPTFGQAGQSLLATLVQAASREGRRLIVGGAEVDPAFKYPWLSSLQTSDGHSCGGTMISPRWFLTAAHCIETSAPANSYKILFHGHSVTGQAIHSDGCTETLHASRIVCHPSYNKQTMEADVCLLHLPRAFRCASELQNRNKLPILDTIGSGRVIAGRVVTVAGWGTLESNGDAPDRMHEVFVPLISYAQCNGADSYDGSILSGKMICAGLFDTGGKDSCQGALGLKSS
eukprot:3981097-Pleurochrysis_carterae.AAC.3